MKYPLFRLKLILAGDWHQFNNWLRENPIQEGEDIVFVRDIQSLVGRQKDNVELVKTGEWYKNEVGKEAIKKLYPFFTDELYGTETCKGCKIQWKKIGEQCPVCYQR
jgi:hypothetical protein